MTIGTPVDGVINPPGDQDYYTFEGTEGQWLQFVTEANPDDDPALVDTVITVFDADGNQLAENDDSQPRVNTDSEITTRLPATGTYYVLVQEYSTWVGDPDEGQRDFTYTLTVGELNVDAAAVNVDGEAGDDLASAQALSEQTGTGGSFSLIAGDFDAADDIDVYTLTIPDGDAAGYSVYYMADGPQGNGSTTTPGSMWITSADGTEIIARVSLSDTDQLNPSLPPGTYQLFVSAPGTTGSNDFYVLKAFRGGDNPAEIQETENNDITTPELVTIEGSPPSGFLLATLGDGDVDHFAIEMQDGELVTVACGSRTSGSGVVDLTATLLDSTGTMTLATSTETAIDGAFIEDQAVPAAGTYILRLTKALQDADVTGTWVRCGIYITLP
jgi:hypothetical protein